MELASPMDLNMILKQGLLCSGDHRSPLRYIEIIFKIIAEGDTLIIHFSSFIIHPLKSLHSQIRATDSRPY